MKSWGWVVLIILSALWGGAFVFSKVALGELPLGQDAGFQFAGVDSQRHYAVVDRAVGPFLDVG